MFCRRGAPGWLLLAGARLRASALRVRDRMRAAAVECLAEVGDAGCAGQQKGALCRRMRFLFSARTM
jgi:hypothetical protein